MNPKLLKGLLITGFSLLVIVPWIVVIITTTNCKNSTTNDSSNPINTPLPNPQNGQGNNGLIPSPCPPIMNIIICPIALNCSRLEGLYRNSFESLIMVSKKYHNYDICNTSNVLTPMTRNINLEFNIISYDISGKSYKPLLSGDDVFLWRDNDLFLKIT